ncbi:FepD ABC-type Fe3+-siderophore transport system, permease component [Candidatus Nanopelagicaceae bacterium]|jgi:iron complex transport system permease protein
MRKLLPAVLLAVAFLLSLYLGATQIESFWSALVNPGSNEILWQIRFPRVTAAVIVGAALGVAGLLAQGACNNAVAEPAILGTAAGASFGAVIAISSGLVDVGSLGAIACGTIGALLTTSLTFRLAAVRGALSSFTLIIVGIAVSAIFTSLVGIASAMVSRADARSISFWSFGSLALITSENLIGIALTTVIGIAIAWKIAPALDRLSLGDATAFHLGVNVSRIRLIALIALSILAGGAVSTVGSIAFIGLAAPHIARFIYGPSHRRLVAHSAIIGGLIVVVADTLSRTIAQPNELPIGLATALLGAPVLIALVTFKNNVWRTQ